MEKQQYVYLINGEVLKSFTPYPNKDNFVPCLYATYEDYLEDWKQSLYKLDCDESELDKIRINLCLLHFVVTPLDITSITTVKDGKVYFKEVESESNEVVIGYVAINDKSIISGIYSNLERLKEDYLNSKHCKLTTI